MKTQAAILSLRSAHAALVRAKSKYLPGTEDFEYAEDVVLAKAQLWQAVQQAAELGLDHVSILSHLNQKLRSGEPAPR